MKLQHFGYSRIVVASSGEEALAKVAEAEAEGEPFAVVQSNPPPSLPLSIFLLLLLGLPFYRGGGRSAEVVAALTLYISILMYPMDVVILEIWNSTGEMRSVSLCAHLV